MPRTGSNRRKKQARDLAKASAIPYTTALAQLQQLDHGEPAESPAPADDQERCDLCEQFEDCEQCEGSGEDAYSFGECFFCGGSGVVAPDHCCACGGSPYCDCCPRCGGCVGDCSCPVTVQMLDGTVRTL